MSEQKISLALKMATKAIELITSMKKDLKKETAKLDSKIVSIGAGPIGPSGPSGAKGDKGDKGDTGDAGPQGPQGIQGPAGANGINGTNGTDGSDGYTPVKGVDYFDGVDGADGAVGPEGPQGPAGPGVPSGGTTGQMLFKQSATNFDTYWSDAPTHYSYFAIWAEENAVLGASNTYEWAFGNGANCPADCGTAFIFDCECIGMGLTVNGGAAVAEVQIVHNGTPDATRTVSINGTTKGTNTFSTPLLIAAGDHITFRTLSSNATGSPAIVTAWFRKAV